MAPSPYATPDPYGEYDHVPPVWSGSEVLVVTSGATPAAIAYDPATDRWRTLPAPPRPMGYPLGLRRWFSVWTGDSWIVLATGGGDHVLYSAGKWEVIPSPDHDDAFMGGAAWVEATDDVIVWPSDLADAPVSRAFHVGSRTWRMLAPTPSPGCSAARGVAYEGKVLFTCENQSRVLAYDPVSDTWSFGDEATYGYKSFADINGNCGPAFFGAHLQFDGTPGAYFHPGLGSFVELPPSRFGTVPITGWAGAGHLWMWGSRSAPAHGLPKYYAQGVSFDPATRRWYAMPEGGPTPSRATHAVWTGCEAIVYDASTTTGAIFRP